MKVFRNLTLFSAALVIIPCLYFWSVSLYRLTMVPGIYNDEVEDLAPVLYANSHRIGDERFPTYIGEPYRGLTESFLLRPVFAVTGIRISAVRRTMLLFSFAAAVLFALAARQVFGGRAAAIFLAGILTNTAFLYHSRIGVWGAHSTTWLLAGCALFGVARFRADGRSAWLCLSAFCLGLGSHTHHMIFFLTGGLVLGGYIFPGNSPRPNRRALLFSAASFAVGFSPFLISNALITGWSGLTDIAHIFSRALSHSGSRHALSWANVAVRSHQLVSLFDGTVIPGVFPRLPLPLFLAAVIPLMPPFALLFKDIRKRLGEKLPHVYALLAACVFYFFSMTLNLCGLQYSHLLPLVPLIMLIDAAILSCAVPLTKNAAATAVLATAAAAAITAQGIVLRRIFSFHDEKGGYSIWASATAQTALVSYLSAHGIARPFSLEFGACFPVIALSGGAIVPVDIRPPDPDTILKACRQRPNALFITVADECKTFTRDLAAMLQAAGLKKTNERYFTDKLGNPVYETFNLAPIEGNGLAVPKKTRP